MSRHNCESIGALVDGELRGIRRLIVQWHLRDCPICAAEYRHQDRVKKMLASYPPTARLTDSDDFFWSKVKNEIQQNGVQPLQIQIPRLSVLDWIRQNSVAVGTAGVAVMAVVGSLWMFQILRSTSEETPTQNNFAQVEQMVTTIPNTEATAVESEEAGITVISLSGIPWTRDMEEMKAWFENLDS